MGCTPTRFPTGYGFAIPRRPLVGLRNGRQNPALGTLRRRKGLSLGSILLTLQTNLDKSEKRWNETP